MNDLPPYSYPPTETLNMPNTTRRHEYAHIELGPHPDGRWMWAISWWADSAGEGFALHPKWGCSADTKTDAIRQAAQHLAKSGRGSVKEWAQSLLQPTQQELFA